jgi:hypothetical protein
VSDGRSRIIVPLATTVEPTYANDVPYRESLLKLASVLYDEVLFERGAFSVSIGDEGAVQHEWADDAALDFDRILNARWPFKHIDIEMEVDPGAAGNDGMQFSVDGRPVDQPITFLKRFDSCVEYASEIEHSVAARLAEFNDGWLIAVDPVARPVDEFSLLFYNKPGENLWEQYASATLNRMTSLAKQHDAALAVGPTHRSAAHTSQALTSATRAH